MLIRIPNSHPGELFDIRPGQYIQAFAPPTLRVTIKVLEGDKIEVEIAHAQTKQIAHTGIVVDALGETP